MTDDTLNEYLKLFNGIQDPETDLNLPTEEAYTTLLNWILTNTREWVNTYTGKSYTEATAPAGINQTIIDIASNTIKEMAIRKDLPIRDSDNTNLYDLIETIITSDIEKRLSPYMKKNKIHVFTIKREDTEEEEEVD